MSAMPQRDDLPNRSNKDIVQRFREQYQNVLAEALVSAEHAATEG